MLNFHPLQKLESFVLKMESFGSSLKLEAVHLTWYPLTNIENTYTHSQSTPTTVWNINHRLNTTDFVYQIFDSTESTVVANMDIIDADNASITFGEPVAGTVTLVAVPTEAHQR